MPSKDNAPADEIQSRLAEWQQGDFTLDCGEMLFLGNAESKGDGHESFIDEGFEGCVVISQTCDIVRKIEKHPCVTVCPLVKVDQKRISDIDKGLAPGFGLVDNLPDGVVVDFSWAMSVRKDLLVSWKRQRGCPGDRSRIEFAKSIERFFGRFAFPDAFSESLESLRKAVTRRYGKDSDFGRALKSIRELRVRPHADWDDAVSVPLTFVAILENDGEREIEDRDSIYAAIMDKVMEVDWKDPFLLHETSLHVATLSELTAADYMNSYPLDMNALSHARRYQQGR